MSVTVIWGRDKVGKTHLALTWPRPLLLDNDRRYGLVVPKFSSAMVEECKVPISFGKMAVTDAQAWADFQARYAKALENKGIDTIIVDTLTKLRMILVECTPRDEWRKPPYHYTWSNNQLEMIVALARHHKKNLVLIHRAGDEYEGGNPTGGDTLKGYKDIRYLADMTVHLEALGDMVHCTIEGCGWTKTLNGVMVPSPTYQAIMGIIAKKLEEEIV